MISTFVIDTPAVFALSLLVSFFVVDCRGERPFYARWPFGHALLLASLFFLTALASYAVAPDWMCMYYLEDSRLGIRALAYMALALYLAPGALGFGLGLELRRRSRMLAVLALGATLAGEALVVGSVWDRYTRVGTLKEWRTGGGTPLPRHAAVQEVSAVGGISMALVFAAMVVGHVPRRRGWRRSGEPFYLNQGEESVVEAAASRLLPGDPRPGDLARELSAYIGSMVGPNRLGLRVVIFAFQWLPLLVLGVPRRFTSLAETAKDHYIDKLDRHRSPELRTVLIILKTLLCMLYFERSEVRKAIGADHHCLQRNRPPAFPETPRVAAASS